MRQTRLNRLLGDFHELPLEEKEYVTEILQRQLTDAKRDRLALRAKEAETNLRKGKVKRGSVEDLMKDLDID